VTILESAFWTDTLGDAKAILTMLLLNYHAFVKFGKSKPSVIMISASLSYFPVRN